MGGKKHVCRVLEYWSISIDVFLTRFSFDKWLMKSGRQQTSGFSLITQVKNKIL
jgi:hypothetical protein